MKSPLRLAASILLLASARAGHWPYHGIVGVGQSTPVFVAPVYGVAPAVSLLPPEPADGAKTVVAGPVTGTTIVEGSSSGPVIVVSPGTPVSPAPPAPPPVGQKAADAAARARVDTVLVKGASSGPVTLVAPTSTAAAAGSVAKGAVEASARVAVASKEESSIAEASANATTIGGTIGVASANAVIGPSTGPVVIAGPTAPAVPIAVSTSTAEPVTAAASTTEPVATSTVASAVGASANASVSSTSADSRIRDESGPAADATKSTKRIEGSVSSSSSVTSTSGSASATATARVNLITSTTVIAADEPTLSNVVVSAAPAPAAVISGPSGTISAGSVSPVLFKASLYHL